MMEEKNKKKFWQKIKESYHLKIYNDETFQEEWFFRFSRLKGYTISFSTLLLIVIIISCLIFYTPVRELIPGYPDKNVKRGIIENSIKLDSLALELKNKDLFIANIINVMNGKEPIDFNDYLSDSTENTVMPDFEGSGDISDIRDYVDMEQSYNLSENGEYEYKGLLRDKLFYCPLKGEISGRFNNEAQHYGIDIVADENEPVHAVLDGVVMLALWDMESGYLIQIQHDNNLISIYKHNSDLMKVTGEEVKAGDVIAIIGNSGELTTGQHLHFELWHNKRAINPEEYIVF